jgi:cell division cycle 14
MTLGLETQLAERIEFMNGRLAWTTLLSGPPPQDTPEAHYFSVEDVFRYEPFATDFGPLNLAMTFRYCVIVEQKLRSPDLVGKCIVQYTSSKPEERTNAALLVCAYMIIAQRSSAENAFAPMRALSVPLLPFRDVSAHHMPRPFQLTVLDCLMGLQHAIEVGLFDWTQFDVDTYEFFERVENGDINWVLPKKVRGVCWSIFEAI